MYYFIKVPRLPATISHQMGNVEIIEYAVKENERIKSDQTIVLVGSWWVRMALKAVGSGYISKVFFEPRTYVREGDPLAIMVCDPEDAPHGEVTCALEIVETIRQKPGREK